MCSEYPQSFKGTADFHGTRFATLLSARQCTTGARESRLDRSAPTVGKKSFPGASDEVCSVVLEVLFVFPQVKSSVSGCQPPMVWWGKRHDSQP